MYQRNIWRTTITQGHHDRGGGVKQTGKLYPRGAGKDGAQKKKLFLNGREASTPANSNRDSDVIT